MLSLLHNDIVHKFLLKAVFIQEQSNTSNIVQTVIEKVDNNQ